MLSMSTTIAQNLIRLRKQRSPQWDQADLAKQAGISQSAISKIENGGYPTTDTLEALALALSVTVSDLITPPPAPDLTADQQARAAAYDRAFDAAAAPVGTP